MARNHLLSSSTPLASKIFNMYSEAGHTSAYSMCFLSCLQEHAERRQDVPDSR